MTIDRFVDPDDGDADAPAEGFLASRTALVTGAARRVGRALALALAAEGAHVVIHHHTAVDEAKALAKEIRHRGGSADVLPGDLADAAVARALPARAAELSGNPLDILVNNAAGNFLYPSEKLPIAGWKAVIDIVLNGTFYCSQIIGNQMIAQGGGQMINILATYAWHGGPGTVHSASAKAGVLAMTRTLAVEWARHNIRVNAIAPGPFDTEGARTRLWPTEELQKSITDEIPLNRFADLQEVARAVLYLTSPYASYITGECLVIDGGAWLGKGIGRIMDKVDQFAEMREASRRNRMGNK